MNARPEDIREFMADLEIASDRSDERDALGWVVVTVDDESESIVHATGLFDTPEAALIHAANRHVEDLRTAEGDEDLWTHTVVPMFKGDES